MTTSFSGILHAATFAWRVFENKSSGINLILVPNLSWVYDLRDNLLSFSPNQPIWTLPEMETDLLRNRGVSASRRAERAAFWTAYAQKKPGIYLISAEALAQKMPSLPYWSKQSVLIERDAPLSCLALSERLLELGYESVELVEKPFEFAQRGSIVDVFPPGALFPARLELFGDEVESIHTFYPDSQRRKEELTSLVLPPAREFLLPVNDADRAKIKSELRELLDKDDWERSTRNELLERIDMRSFFPTIDLWGPIITSAERLPLEHWKEIISRCDCLHVFEPIQSLAASKKAKKLQEKDFLSAKIEGEWVPSPEQFLLSDEEIQALEAIFSNPAFEYTRSLSPGAAVPFGTLETLISQLAIAREHYDQNSLKDVAQILKNSSSGKFVFFLSSSSEFERLKFLLGHYGVDLRLVENLGEALEGPLGFYCLLGSLSAPFRDENKQISFLNDEQLLGTKKHRLGGQQKASQRFSDVHKGLSLLGLRSGLPVVHKEHGIAKYLGMKTMTLNGVVSDFLELEYVDGKVFVPVIKLSLIQKYSGGEEARLDRLSTRSWEQKKSRAKKELQSIAGELLDLYSKRKLAKAPSLKSSPEREAAFAASFPFSETADQLQAIQDTLNDLSQPSPMDRLVCGDVGYGKTEVALRAAFACVDSGHQACVLVPTTLLAAQHFKSFEKRFANFGFKVGILSRFTPKDEAQRTIENLNNGSLHVVIGTHRLLSNDISFKNLALLIVDEEQRFGVSHKEKIKRLKTNLHVLTLTATPIPRTMNMAMSGIRDLSIIATPPQSRLSVRTYVSRRKDSLISEAVDREISRGGQVFFVHNRVQDIEQVYNTLKQMFPRYALSYVHGQMDEVQLEERMLSFYDGKTQVLITTSIIESGLDVPNANTLIVDRADRFGLAQLYQMRGRVGRSDKRAFAYLLLPEKMRITRDAEERLSVLESYQELGSGFHIASHDLDLRGAGDLLGRAQSGQISALGFEAFNELLQECIAEVKGEHLEDSIEPEINLPIDLTIPEDYIREVSLRLLFYRRLSAALSEAEVQEIEHELEDRFGPLPQSVRHLVIAMELKCVLRRLRVRSLSSGKAGLLLSFDPQTPIQPSRLVEQIKKFPHHFSLHPDGRLALLNLPQTGDPAQLLRAVEAAVAQVEGWCGH